MQPEPPAAPAAPEAPVAPEVEDTFDGGKFNPDDLPPELQPGWKQLQAAWTHKTQEHAEQLKQIEALGDLESIQQAVELRERIANPENWEALHAELTEAMEASGMTPAQAKREADELVTEAKQPPALDADLQKLTENDPDLAPLVQQLQAQRAELDAIKSAREEALETQEAERFQQGLLHQMQKEEHAIRQANPSYEDRDMDAVTAMSSFFNGSLLKAQEELEEYVGHRLERYLATKDAPASVLPPAPSIATSHKSEGPTTVEEAASEAEEYVRQLQAAGELDMSGF